MSNNWFFSVIISFLLISLSLWGRIQQGNWFAPGAFFTLFWTGGVLTPLFFAPDYEVLPWAVLWIFISCLSFYAGTLVGGGGWLSQLPRRGKIRDLYFSKICSVALICIASGIIAIVIILWSAGYSLTVFLSLEEVVRMGHNFSVARYLEGYNSPSIVRYLLMPFVYLSAILGGLLFSPNSSKTYRLIGLLSLVPIILIGIINAARLGIFLSIIFWVTSYISSRIFLYRGEISLFARRNLLVGFFLLLILFSVAVLLKISRGGTISVDTIPVALSNVRVGSLGYLSAFSQWFGRTWFSYGNKIGWGAFNFAGIFDQLGLHKREIGLFTESVKVNGVNTNIYTLFRELIEDFTLGGSLLVLFAGGILAMFVYRRVIEGKALYLPALIAFYSVTLCSFATNIFNYNSIVVGFLLLQGYLLVSSLYYPNKFYRPGEVKQN